MASYNPNDPRHRSWIEVPPGHDFPIQNLPFGAFSAPGRGTRAGVAIGDWVLDLAEVGFLDAPNLNPLLEEGPDAWKALRQRVSWLLHEDNPELRDNPSRQKDLLLRRQDVEMCVPVRIGDYVDFYSSLDHATNVGKMFRDPSNPLLPNWKHLPVGYHGRSGTVIAAGTPVKRPKGQLCSDDRNPVYAPTRRLDIELETAFVIGQGSELGVPVPVAEASSLIFGLVLLNDWSARDIQRWEYQPLGPFLGKSFATSISPWVVTLDALEPFRVPAPHQDPAPLPYLAGGDQPHYGIHLEVLLKTPQMDEPFSICRTDFRHLYWTMSQQLAHLTSNGASVRPGDLCGSGTISGPDPDSFGSLLELTWNGTKPLALPTGETRSFLEDGDTVILRGWCEGSYRIGFGELRTQVLAA